ncbi:MAG: response regulator [Candidatus Omnitrophota bacterium]
MPEIRILIVDDEKELAESMFDLLEYEGYSVELAGTGEEALQRVDMAYPDLLILDIKLPGINGLDVLQHVRETRSFLPILIVSASSQKGTRERAKELGADDVLLKPFDEEELLSIIKKLLEKR